MTVPSERQETSLVLGLSQLPEGCQSMAQGRETWAQMVEFIYKTHPYIT